MKVLGHKYSATFFTVVVTMVVLEVAMCVVVAELVEYGGFLSALVPSDSITLENSVLRDNSSP